MQEEDDEGVFVIQRFPDGHEFLSTDSEISSCEEEGWSSCEISESELFEIEAARLYSDS
jgi:hypothetical protein